MQARVLLPLAIQGPPPPWDQVVHVLHGPTMGTSWSVRLVAPAELNLAVLKAGITRVLDDVIAEMSQWEAGSALSRFNRAGAGSQHVLPAGFASVIDAALEIARISGGAFDPTVLELVRHWGFGPPGAVEQARCDWRELAWDGMQLTQSGRARLDLSAIAKGHAVDRLAQSLCAWGIQHHLVEVGGELRGTGLKPDGQPWWVDIEPPDEACQLAPLRIALHDLAVATSGDYRRFRIDACGLRRSHTIDPRSGKPVAHGLASVSVVHGLAMWADGWSTALMVLGLEEGLSLARENGLAARFVRREGKGFSEHLSPALAELLE